MTASKFSITLSLNVLNHLGMNLYSNVPAILSEVVANAWDADAQLVDIKINSKDKIITVTDDGHGMTEKDLNSKFLTVGYMRREREAITPKFKRKVMGRKGIGKLSLFSIANTIEVHSVKDGQKNGLIMRLDEIQNVIKAHGSAVYNPQPVDPNKITIKGGTQIILTDLRKDISRTQTFLRKRLARRFAVIGKASKFTVSVDQENISIQDRDYFKKLQYLWTFGPQPDIQEYIDNATNVEKYKHLDDGQFESEGVKYSVSGWIGTFAYSGDAKTEDESLNNISVIVRGKLAQEDILSEFGDAGVYATYLIGEVQADFLDVDDKGDIATSSRQRLIEDDPRYLALKNYLNEKLAQIRTVWTAYRNSEGEAEARKNPVIDDWFKELGTDTRSKAKSLFGKINQMTIDEKAKSKLFVHGVLAFESFRYKDQLNALDNISVNDLGALATIFQNFDDIEANMFYQITKERIAVIDALRQKLSDDVREKVMQEHIFRHLWLLDPMWERATETAIMEQQVRKEFDGIAAGLNDEETKGRLDIKYKNTAGKHVIIELKRASVSITTEEIIKQIRKYIKALEKCLQKAGRENEPIEAVVILGREPTDWQDSKERERSRQMLAAIDARVLIYDSMLDQAYRAYEKYIEKNREVSKLAKILDSLDVNEG